MIKKNIYKGKIAYLSQKGYGFIRPISAPKRINIYFHASSIKNAGGRFIDLMVGDSIGFGEVVNTTRGQIANLIVIDYE